MSIIPPRTEYIQAPLIPHRDGSVTAKALVPREDNESSMVRYTGFVLILMGVVAAALLAVTGDGTDALVGVGSVLVGSALASFSARREQRDATTYLAHRVTLPPSIAGLIDPVLLGNSTYQDSLVRLIASVESADERTRLRIVANPNSATMRAHWDDVDRIKKTLFGESQDATMIGEWSANVILSQAEAIGYASVALDKSDLSPVPDDEENDDE